MRFAMWGRSMVAIWGGLAAALSAGSGVGLADSTPAVTTDRGCYVVGEKVELAGSGFAPQRRYDVAVDGVDFGQATTDASGAFATHFVPGGLAAGVVQSVDHVDVTDGTSDAGTSFTLTRQTGARFEASRGNPRTLKVPFQVWGFAMDGTPRPLFLHYVSPSGQLRKTVALGRAGGQCGYLLTPRMRVFPFAPTTGRWTLQVDTAQSYAAQPTGPVARITVVIRRG
jgi:hypothetical protein